MLENAWNQAGAQEMNQAPEPMAQVAQGQEQAAPAIPGQKVSFDVNQNPQDMQMMTDAMMYAPMLKSMDEDQRKEKWPQMVQSLSQVSPKASALFDPSLPPSDKDLDALMSRMQAPKGASDQNAESKGMGQLASAQDDFMAEQVKRQLKGEKAESIIEFNARKSGEDQKKQEEDTRAKQLQASLNADPVHSDQELIFKGALLSGQGSKYMTADNSGSVVPSIFGEDKPKVSPNYEPDPNNPGAFRAIKGTPADPVMKQAEALAKQQGSTKLTAGQVALVKTANAMLPNIVNGPWDDNYDFDVKAMGAAQSGAKPRWTSIAVGDKAATKADIYNQSISVLSEAALKAATGAQASAEETKKYEKMFRCTVGDNADSCLNKVITAKLFTQNLASTLKDDPSTPTGKNVDQAKVKTMIDGNKVRMYEYKESWKSRFFQANPKATDQDANRVWVKEMINNPEFATKVLSEDKQAKE